MELALVDHGADRGRGLERIADLRFQALVRPLDEAVVDASVTTNREDAVQRWPVEK